MSSAHYPIFSFFRRSFFPMFPFFLGINIYLLVLVTTFCSKKKAGNEAPVEKAPEIRPKTPVANSPKTTESNVKTPISPSPSPADLKPEPTQPSLVERPPPTQEKTDDDYRMHLESDIFDDDTKDDAQSLQPVDIDVRSDSFPLVKKQAKTDRTSGRKVRLVMAKRSQDKISIMKEDVTAEDTDISVREQKKKTMERLGKKQEKSKDEVTAMEKRKTLRKSVVKGKLVNSAERKGTELIPKKTAKSKEEKTKEEKSADAFKPLVAKKSNDRLKSSADKAVISLECYHV